VGGGNRYLKEILGDDLPNFGSWRVGLYLKNMAPKIRTLQEQQNLFKKIKILEE
jgi:hypothetical protein